MKEVEILVEVISPKDKVLEKLSAFSAKGEKKVLDIYYVDPLRENLKPDSSGQLKNSFRIRNKDGKTSMAYKIDHFDKLGIWTHSDEYEMEVSDINTSEQIVKNLGLVELVRIDNLKHTYETDNFEIVFEEVNGLGNFLEVELLKQVSDNEVLSAKENIRFFINSLNIETTRELNMGKPELMLRKMSGGQNKDTLLA